MEKEKVGPKISLVIPSYNEEKNILEILKKCESYFTLQKYLYEVLVVDDGSTDSTLTIAQNFASTNKNIRVISLSHKGKGSAVMAGLSLAKGKYVLCVDADLAVPLDETRKIIHYIEDAGFDICIASRQGVGAVRHNESFFRRLLSRSFNYIVRLLLIKDIKDTQCGFKAYTQTSLKKVLPKLKIYSEAKEIPGPKIGAIEVEILFVSQKHRLKIKSIPVEWTYTKVKRVILIKDTFVKLKDVFKVWYYNKKNLYT
jgi:glycosyltransferase involved in cell wall biosynthesis